MDAASKTACFIWNLQKNGKYSTQSENAHAGMTCNMANS
jgi:hypothetical protein